MKHWKQFREPWEKDGRFLLRASSCWDTSSLTVLWWKSSSLQVLSFLAFPHLLWKHMLVHLVNIVKEKYFLKRRVTSSEISTDHANFFKTFFYLYIAILHTYLKKQNDIVLGWPKGSCFPSCKNLNELFGQATHLLFYCYFWYYYDNISMQLSFITLSELLYNIT